MAKKIAGTIRLQIKAQEATPGQPIGPALGQRGLNIMEFVKAFNDQSSSYEKGTPLPVVITAYDDRSFSFILKAPPVSWYLTQAVGIDKGSAMAGRQPVGEISMETIQTIAKQKAVDCNTNNTDSIARSIAGSARSMGLRVVD